MLWADGQRTAAEATGPAVPAMANLSSETPATLRLICLSSLLFVDAMGCLPVKNLCGMIRRQVDSVLASGKQWAEGKFMSRCETCSESMPATFVPPHRSPYSPLKAGRKGRKTHESAALMPGATKGGGGEGANKLKVTSAAEETFHSFYYSLCSFAILAQPLPSSPCGGAQSTARILEFPLALGMAALNRVLLQRLVLADILFLLEYPL